MTQRLSELEAHFRASGKFMTRDGRARRSGLTAYINQKLCLVATDKEYLVGVLYEASDAPDCFYVKYLVNPKDGMYLGRIFVTTRAAVGERWARYKVDRKLMCTVQDDDYLQPFREKYNV